MGWGWGSKGLGFTGVMLASVKQQRRRVEGPE